MTVKIGLAHFSYSTERSNFASVGHCRFSFIEVHTMIDETLAQFRARRQNINRYRSLLQTSLTEFERRFIERRIAEEEAAVSALAFGASPPDMPPPRAA
jgi:hypothetical protein